MTAFVAVRGRRRARPSPCKAAPVQGRSRERPLPCKAAPVQGRRRARPLPCEADSPPAATAPAIRVALQLARCRARPSPCKADSPPTAAAPAIEPAALGPWPAGAREALQAGGRCCQRLAATPVPGRGRARCRRADSDCQCQWGGGDAGSNLNAQLPHWQTPAVTQSGMGQQWLNGSLRCRVLLDSRTQVQVCSAPSRSLAGCSAAAPPSASPCFPAVSLHYPEPMATQADIADTTNSQKSRHDKWSKSRHDKWSKKPIRQIVKKADTTNGQKSRQ